MMLPLLLAAQVPPPVVVSSAPPLGALVTWRLGDVRCGGEVVAPVRAELPLAAPGWAGSGDSTTILRFRIDADGRAVGIGASPGFGAERDLAPALAATRFAAGLPRDECRAGYVATRTPIAEAPIDALMRYTIFPQQRPTAAIWDRVRSAGACATTPPALRSRAFPDFDAIPQPPATFAWSMIGFDVDDRGHPVRARVVTGSGNRALDDAAVGAVERSRFAAGARTGCLYPYWRRGPVLAAPAPVDKEALRPADATCPASREWARAPVLSYPDAFRRRGIEGWAIVAFDVAPWGETGNVRVISAEPAAAFGEEAVGIIRRAAAKPGAGGTGCIERVRFSMGVPGGRGQVPADEAPPPY